MVNRLDGYDGTLLRDQLVARDQRSSLEWATIGAEELRLWQASPNCDAVMR